MGQAAAAHNGDIVVLVEERSQGEAIAAALGFPGKSDGAWRGQHLHIVSASGHLLSRADPDEINPKLNWGSLDGLLPIPRDPHLRPIPGGKPSAAQRLKRIDAALKRASGVIVATDADREGEYIGTSILGHLKYGGPAQRAWLSVGLDRRSVEQAFNDLRPLAASAGWAQAAAARDAADWYYQHLSRAYTTLGRRGAYGPELATGDRRASVISVGRVQTPALALIAKREEEIQAFRPELRYRARVFVGGCEVPFEYTPEEGEGYSLDEAAVQAFAERLRAAAELTAGQLDTKEEFRAAPKLLNLTDAQTALSRATGVSMRDAQSAYEELYAQGWLSYPRTRRRELPRIFWQEMGAEILDAMGSNPALAALVARIKAEFGGADESRRPKGLRMLTDKGLEHFAIIPTSAPMTGDAFSALSVKKGKAKLSTQTLQQAWLLAAGRLALNLLPPAHVTRLRMTAGAAATGMYDEAPSRFWAAGLRVVDPGWSAYVPGSFTPAELPAVAVGTQLRISSVDVTARQTKPPPRYTEASFVKAMEEVGKDIEDPALRAQLKDADGIGTPATRSAITETLRVRQYVRLSKGKYYLMPRGKALIDMVPDLLRLPEVTALWENALEKMCDYDGQTAATLHSNFIDRQRATIEGLVQEQIQSHSGVMDNRDRMPPSKKQIKVAEDIAARAGVTVPEAARRQRDACSAFIEQHGTPRASTPAAERPPSDKQLRFAEKLAGQAGVEVPADARQNAAGCSKFIGALTKKLGPRPPSARQLEFAQQVARDQQVRLPQAAQESAAACSKFIDKHRPGGAQGPAANGTRADPGRPPSEQQLVYLRRLAQSIGEPVPEAAYQTAGSCSAMIKQMEAVAPPSEPLLRKARVIADAAQVPVPASAQQSVTQCRRFIERLTETEAVT